MVFPGRDKPKRRSSWRRRGSIFTFKDSCLTLGLLLVATLCSQTTLAQTHFGRSDAAEQPASPRETPVDTRLFDLAGELHDLRQNDARRTRAFVFLSPECPVSNTYTPRLNQLAHELSASGVELFAVVSDPTLKRAEVARHYRE